MRVWLGLMLWGLGSTELCFSYVHVCNETDSPVYGSLAYQAGGVAVVGGRLLIQENDCEFLLNQDLRELEGPLYLRLERNRKPVHIRWLEEPAVEICADPIQPYIFTAQADTPWPPPEPTEGRFSIPHPSLGSCQTVERVLGGKEAVPLLFEEISRPEDKKGLTYTLLPGPI